MNEKLQFWFQMRKKIEFQKKLFQFNILRLISSLF